MNFEGIENSIWRNYESFHISHDAEGDDIHALVIASYALKNENFRVDCTIGNRKIVHNFASNDIDSEMNARLRLTNEIFGTTIAIPGAKNQQEISEAYVEEILTQSKDKNSLVLHLDCFKSLQALFERSSPGQLKNVVIFAYGSSNINWAMKEKLNENDFKIFYGSLAKSGAKLVQLERKPFLEDRNIYNVENTPVTYTLLQHLDGPVGIKWTEINEKATESIRSGEAKLVAESICKAIQIASDEKKIELKKWIGKLPHMDGRVISDTLFEDSKELHQYLNHSLDFIQHKLFKSIIMNIGDLLVLIHNDKKLLRTVDTYFNTSLKGQGLIADQIPAILFTELLEGRKNGLIKEILPVKFNGLDGSYIKYAISEDQSSLFCLNTAEKAKMNAANKEKLIDGYLKYLDLCIASALLYNEKVIEPDTKQKLLTTSFAEDLKNLAEKVKESGFDLPASYTQLRM